MTTRSSFTKQQLAKDLGETGKRLTTILKTMEPDILKLFPGYNPQCQILHPKIYKYILGESGFEPYEVNEIMHQRRVSTFFKP